MRGASSSERRLRGATARQWAQLQMQAQSLAQLAGLAPERDQVGATAFSELLERAARRQCDLAREALEDIDAMIEPGIAALNTISGRGQDTVAPALALWREYHAARSDLLEMLAPASRSEERDFA